MAREWIWEMRGSLTSITEIDQASAELYAELGRYPTDEEIAGRLGVTSQQYQEDLANASLCNLLSLDSVFDDQEQGGPDVADHDAAGAHGRAWRR